MSIRMQQKRDTAANWTSNNPTLASGEIGFETDTSKIKIGDGSTAWTGLSYFTGAGISSLVEDTTPQLGGDLDMNGNEIEGVDATEMGYVVGVTSSIQTQINAKIGDVVDDTTPQLGGDLDNNEKSIALTPEPTSDHTGNGDVVTMTVDANTYGIASALHLDTDGNWIEADADVSSAGAMPCQGLALETGTGSKKILLRGFMRDDSWSWTVGGLIYVSTTAGTLTQTAPSATGDQVQVVGFATHADRIFFNPSMVLVEVA